MDLAPFFMHAVRAFMCGARGGAAIALLDGDTMLLDGVAAKMPMR